MPDHKRQQRSFRNSQTDAEHSKEQNVLAACQTADLREACRDDFDAPELPRPPDDSQEHDDRLGSESHIPAKASLFNFPGVPATTNFGNALQLGVLGDVSGVSRGACPAGHGPVGQAIPPCQDARRRIATHR